MISTTVRDYRSGKKMSESVNLFRQLNSLIQTRKFPFLWGTLVLIQFFLDPYPKGITHLIKQHTLFWLCLMILPKTQA